MTFLNASAALARALASSGFVRNAGRMSTRRLVFGALLRPHECPVFHHLLIVFVLLVVCSPTALACQRGVGPNQSPASPATDSELNVSDIAAADIAFVGVLVRDTTHSFPTYRVIGSVKGAKPGDIVQGKNQIGYTCADSHDPGSVWFYQFTNPASSPWDRFRIKALELTGMAWTEDTSREKYGVYVETKLRDACGNVTSPKKMEQLKNTFHIDISSMPRFNLPALLDKADKGDADAQSDLEQYYDCRKDESNAKKWAHKAAYTRSISAAHSGDVHAAAVLGWSYANGVATGTPDYVNAAQWLKMAVPAGDPLALTTLAHMYLDGNGVPKDPAQAVFLLTVFMRQGMGFPKAIALCPGRASQDVMRFDKDEVLSCERAAEGLAANQIDTVKSEVISWQSTHCTIPGTAFPCHK